MDPADTVRHLKYMIYERERIPWTQQILGFRNQRLGDYRTLFRYDIENEDFIQLADRTIDMIEIFVKTPTGKTLTIDMTHLETVETLMSQIQELERVPTNTQRL